MSKVIPIVLERLYKRTKRGQTAWYQIEVHFFRRHAEIHTIKAVNLEAKSQSDIEVVDSGVNIGKANEIDLWVNANKRAESRFRKLQDEGYKTTIPTGDSNTDAEGKVKPMLTQKMGNAKDLVYPCYLQPKFDGMRCLALITENDIILYSRKGKAIVKMEHIVEDLKKLQHKKMLPLLLDGELYTHKKISFQQIISATRKSKTNSEDATKIDYYVYDLIEPTQSFSKRFGQLEHLFESSGFEYCKLAVTTEIYNPRDLNSCHIQNIENGYEGSMIRTCEGFYEPGYRSSTLLKVKDFDEDEFEIIGVNEATGRDSGTAIFVCKCKGGEFNCRPMGDFELRSEYWKNRKKLIGKKLTVKYQGLSDDEIPRFPTGKIIRNYE